ncbi:hypothetical protein G7M53_26065 [Escherichia coli]|nr:hypothetical protein [Escherichia coli]
MGSCAAPSAKGDDKFITTDYLQQCQGNYRLYRIEGGTPSVIGIYQRPSSAIVDVIADSIRITHRHADTEDTVLEIQRLATVCRDTLNGMTK